MRIDNDIRIWIITSLLAIACAMAIIVATNVWGSPTTKYFDNHEAVIQQILFLESGNKNIPCAYSDNCTEIGIAQFKPETWSYFQRKSNMHFLSIYNADDQIVMLDWALRNNLGSHWTTYRKAQERAIMGKYIKLK